MRDGHGVPIAFWRQATGITSPAVFTVASELDGTECFQRYRQAQRMPQDGEREARAWHAGAMQMHDLWHYQGRLDREAA